MKKIIAKIIFIATLLCITFATSLPSMASSSRVIALSPMSQKIILTPGETYYGGFIVANPANQSEDLNYLVTIAPYFPEASEGSMDDYGSGNFTTYTNMNMMTDWIEIENPTGTIHPNGSITISFTIAVPSDAPAGGQYASLLVKEDRSANNVEDSVAITEVMQMAHIIYAEVAGDTREDGTILSNNIPSFVLNDTLQTTSMVQNNGNVHTDAEYTLQVWPLGSNEEICTNEEESNTNMIFPSTERYNIQSCKLPLVGVFRAKQTVKIFGEESIVEKTIIVCPLWLLFFIVFVIMALIIWLVMRAKARRRGAE